MDGPKTQTPPDPEHDDGEGSAARPLPNPPRPQGQRTGAGALIEVRWFEPVLIGGAVLLALLALAIGYWLGRSDSEPPSLSSASEEIDTAAPITTPVATVDGNPDLVSPATTTIDQVDTSTESGEATPVDDASDQPESTTPPETTIPKKKPAESKAVVLNGQIFLEGAVPSQEAADEIVALAAAILGEDNVVNNYVIDPDAGDPNLGNIRVADSVLFESGSAVIAEEFEPLLNQAVALMTIRPSVTMKVIGHTDDIGPTKLNKKLSKERARAVVDYISALGIDPSRFTAVGRGELRPIADNTTVEGRQANRRIQVQLENLLAD